MNNYDEELASIQPKTYWEKRCFATEQFIELFFSLCISNMTKSDKELSKHLIAKYQESVSNIPPPVKPIPEVIKKIVK